MSLAILLCNDKKCFRAFTCKGPTIAFTTGMGPILCMPYVSCCRYINPEPYIARLVKDGSRMNTEHPYPLNCGIILHEALLRL